MVNDKVKVFVHAWFCIILFVRLNQSIHAQTDCYLQKACVEDLLQSKVWQHSKTHSYNFGEGGDGCAVLAKIIYSFGEGGLLNIQMHKEDTCQSNSIIDTSAKYDTHYKIIETRKGGYVSDGESNKQIIVRIYMVERRLNFLFFKDEFKSVRDSVDFEFLQYEKKRMIGLRYNRNIKAGRSVINYFQ